MNKNLLIPIEKTDIQLIDGDRGENYPSKKEFHNQGYCLFLDSKNITKQGFNFKNKHFITKEKDKVLNTGKLKRNDIVMMTRGSVGKVAFYDETIPFDNIRINSGMIILRCGKQYNAENLYYIFQSDFIQSQIKQLMSGSVQKQLPATVIKQIKLPKNIGNIDLIKKIDSQISNNNAISEELESMAKTIYDYWFLQYEFPDENGKPYKSNGGKMVWNEQLKQEIPVGWKVDNLYKIADFINGIACQKYRPLDNKHKLPVIKITEMHDGFTSKTEFVRDSISKDHIINNGDILFSWSASLETMIWNYGKGGLNQHIFKVIPKNGFSLHYVYQTLSSYIVNFKRMAEARKTTMGHITQDHLKQSRIVIPPQDLINKFENIVKKIYVEITTVDEESQQLKYLRDFLLPMLMNGQVSIKD